MSNYLLLDCSSILSPIKYKLPKLTNDEGEMTQIVFGFFRKVLQLSKKFGTKDLVFVWEGTKHGRHYRKELYPLYKIKKDKEGNAKPDERTDAEKEFDVACYKQFDKCREIVEAIGFSNSFSQDGMESDDVLAMICGQEEHTFHDFVMATGDADMYDCLKYPNTMLYLVNKDKVYTKADFVADHNIQPELWWKVKSIGGCTSDCVPGPVGVAEKTAIKYINGELKETSKKYQAIQDFPKELRVRNKRLVTIPIPQTRPVELKEDELSMEKFMQFCMAQGFDTFVNEQFDDWEAFFKGGCNAADLITNRREQRGR
jgi:5'-3' exonuclease